MAKLSTAVSALQATHWQQRLAPHLVDGETILAFASARHLKPTTEGVAFTNARILGFDTAAPAPSEVVAISVCADEISGYDLTSDRLAPTLTVHARYGPRVFGRFDKRESGFIGYFVESLQHDGIDPAAAGGIEKLREAEELSRQARSRRIAARQRVAVHGEPMCEAQWEDIESQNTDGELPWLILNCGRAGQFAAFDNRVVIIAGGNGRRRVGTFPLSEITALDYRRAVLTGVLEVRTTEIATEAEEPRYWPFVGAAADDAQPNALRVAKPYHDQAADQLEELRRRIVLARLGATPRYR